MEFRGGGGGNFSELVLLVADTQEYNAANMIISITKGTNGSFSLLSNSDLSCGFPIGITFSILPCFPIHNYTDTHATFVPSSIISPLVW